MARIPTLDLFSGIGGFSLALRDHCRTIAYCEIDPVCRDILQNNMLKGELDYAIIQEDVRKFDVSQLLKYKPRGMTFGSPCQDISAAGRGEGVNGVRSTLIFEALKIVKNLPTLEWILMENSSFIITRGLSDIQRVLQSLGFRLESLTLSAADVGAWHLRKRWFGLAWRHNIPSSPKMEKPFRWTVEPVPRIVKYNDRLIGKALRARNERLGNAVVPECVKIAFINLVRRVNNKSLKSGRKHVNLGLQISDGSTRYTKPLWATPCSSPQLWYRNNLSQRNSRVLLVQLLFESHTKTLIRQLMQTPGVVTANPQFVEWLQGFPKDWTAF